MSPAQLSASQKKKTEFEIRNFESGIRFKTDLMHEPEIPATKRKTKKKQAYPLGNQYICVLVKSKSNNYFFQNFTV